MKKPLTTSDSMRGSDASVFEARPISDPWHARAGLDRSAPILRRLLQEIQKRPRLAACVRAIERTWRQLIGSVCELIDPYLSRFFPETRLVAILNASGGIELHKVLKGAATPLGLLGPLDSNETSDVLKVKWTAIELRLRPDQLLERTFSLPAASRDFLGPIIEHKLERLTPWRPDKVLYSYSASAGSEMGGNVSVTLTAISRDLLAAPLQALGGAGLVPTAIGSHQQPVAEPLQVNLLGHKAKIAPIDSERLVSRVVLASVVALIVLYIVSVGWASRAADQQREAGMSLIKARRLLKTASLGSFGDREKALLEAKQPSRSMVVLIDRLATAIPEDTYLKQLSVTSAKMRLVGSSANAPALIGELETIGLVNVRFASAITREKDQTDSFEITADRAAPSAGKQP